MSRPVSLHKRPYIVAVAHFLGSFAYYVSDEAERAEADNAPLCAYGYSGGMDQPREWRVMTDAHPEKEKYDRWLLEHGYKLPRIGT